MPEFTVNLDAQRCRLQLTWERLMEQALELLDREGTTIVMLLGHPDGRPVRITFERPDA